MKEISLEKAFLDLFTPESLVYVIAYDSKNKRPSGMVSSWNTKCSSYPFMFAVALWKKGYTHKLIRSEKEFVVAYPSKEMEQYI